jgi:hydroxymethylpyrimidine/phosphomethylpyrimidine kinase
VDDLPPKAIKTGMLASSPIIQALIQALSEKYSLPTRNPSSTSISGPQTNSTQLPPLPSLIVDPVSVSTSRHSLLSPSAIKDLVFDFLPLCYIVTPNALEAEMIVNCLRARSGSSPTTSASGSTPRSNAASALSEEVLGKAIKDTEDDTGIKVKDLKSMIEVGTEILVFLQSENRGGVNAEKGVLVKGGHVPLTTSAFKAQLRALKKEDVRFGLEVEVVWNGNTLEADSQEEAEHGDFVEILSAYRQALVKAKQGDSTSTQAESSSLDTDIRLDPSSEPAAESSSLDTDIRLDPSSEPAAEVEVKEDECIVDVLLTSTKDKEGVQATLFVAPSIKSRSTHGTGCTLSAAIASNVGHGKSSELSSFDIFVNMGD